MTEDGKLLFHLVEYGTVNLTVTATYGEYTMSKTVAITYSEPQQFDYVSVKDAIDAEVGTTVTVQGIVGPSLVNQKGFYLIDETGLIAVTMTETELANFEMGQLVIIQGLRDVKTKDGYEGHGQTQLKDCTLLLNLYGTHDYSVDHLATDLTFDEFYAFDKADDHTTEVYKIEAYIYVTSNSIKFGNEDGSKQSNLYSSGPAQYYWLKDYAGQKVTLYIVPCNWNSKNYYAGCAVAAVLADGTVIYNTLNFND